VGLLAVKREAGDVGLAVHIGAQKPRPQDDLLGFRLLGLFGHPPGLLEKPVVKLVKRLSRAALSLISARTADRGR